MKRGVHCTSFPPCIISSCITTLWIFACLSGFDISAQTPLPNPDLVRKCSYDIIFVLDESGSIVGQGGGSATVIAPEIRSGSSDLIGSLNGTGSRVAVVEFNSTARRVPIGGSVAYQTINSSYVAAFNNYINVDNNNTPDANQYDPEDYTLLQYFTDWEDAFNKVQIINSTEDTADLVIFFTDGMPTAYINASGTVTQGPTTVIAQQALLEATGAANAVKTQGSHIFVAGISNPNLPESNVQAISGPDKYPVPESDFLKGDYSVSTSATLQQDLAGLAALLTTNTATSDFEYEINWSNHCDSFMVKFTNKSTGATDYYWDFGDSVYSTDTNLTHLFSGGGPFVVMLAAHNDGICGISDTLYDTLSFTLMLDTLLTDFNYTYVPDCDSLLVQFGGTSSDSSIFAWDFGNGQTSNGNSVSAVYTIPGTYDVTMIVSPIDHCYARDTLVKPFTFTPLTYTALADFNYNVIYKNDCDTFVVQFNNLSSGGTSYFWDFGNGITSYDTNATVTYAAGNYDVMLRVNDSRSCSTNDTIGKPLDFTPIITNPNADFDYSITPDCDLVELELTNLSSGANQFTWRLNNNIISSDFTPNAPLIYYQPASLNVELTAKGANNCAVNDTASKAIIIPSPYGYPVADFGFTPSDPEVDEMISFINLSQRADTTHYEWDFGDGTTSTEVNPKHAYSQEGEYEICLSADNGHDCPDIACKDIPIILIAIVDLPTAFTPNGDDNNDIFIVRGENIIKMHLKIFNRWGELVFESRDPYVGWDGSYKSEPQEMEVYDWLLNATLEDGRDVFRKGNVTLLR